MPDGMDTRTTKRLVMDAMAAGLPWHVARRHDAHLTGHRLSLAGPLSHRRGRRLSGAAPWPRLAGDAAGSGPDRGLLPGPSPHPVPRPQTPACG